MAFTPWTYWGRFFFSQLTKAWIGFPANGNYPAALALSLSLRFRFQDATVLVGLAAFSSFALSPRIFDFASPNPWMKTRLFWPFSVLQAIVLV